MADYQGRPSSFFMFCYGDSSKLNIPKAFANKYRDFLRQGSLQLTTDSGRTWNVRVKRNSISAAYQFQITDGWSKFVDDNDLLEMNFLTFRIVGDAALHVSIFRGDSCLEGPPSSLAPPPSPSPSPSEEEDGDEAGETWRMVKELKDHHFSVQRLDIPKDFALGTGISTNYPRVQLENAEGNRWFVSVTNRNIEVYSITGGWSSFLNANSLTVGDILLFEFVKNSDNVVKVVVMEEEEGRELIARSKRGGFIDPYLAL